MIEAIPASESLTERCQRILAGIVGVTTAAALTFDQRALGEATRLAKRVDAKIGGRVA